MKKPLMQHNNAACIDCDNVYRLMVRAGAFIMCPSCAMRAFPEGYDSTSEEYKRRLQKIYGNYSPIMYNK